MPSEGDRPRGKRGLPDQTRALCVEVTCMLLLFGTNRSERVPRLLHSLLED